MIEVYCTGMAQPAKSTMRPPWATMPIVQGGSQERCIHGLVLLGRIASRKPAGNVRREKGYFSRRKRFDQGLASQGL